jgi:hypothetical protein
MVTAARSVSAAACRSAPNLFAVCFFGHILWSPS